jgi:hypothetical protein
MGSTQLQTSQSPLWRKRFCRTGLLVVLGVVGAMCVPPSARLAAAVAAGVALLLGLAVAQVARQCGPANLDSAELPPSPRLARHPELLMAHHSITNSLGELAGQSDEILREASVLKLAAVQEEIRTLASGKLIFAATEAWRTTYERILRTPGLGSYFSVAWLRSEDYWRDAPGKHSIQLNYDLIQLGVRIERTLILNDFFWPPAALLPADVIYRWIEEQYKQGIVMRLVRESEISEEPALLCDFGIYGRRATGVLELDDQCRTVQFTFDFDNRSVQLFEQRWHRLLLFAVSFRDLLDRKVGGA